MLAFPNGIDYRNFDSKRFNSNTFSTYFGKAIKIGPVISEITRAKTTFLTKRQNRHFVPNNSACKGLIATTFSVLVDRCMLIIKLK